MSRCASCWAVAGASARRARDVRPAPDAVGRREHARGHDGHGEPKTLRHGDLLLRSGSRVRGCGGSDATERAIDAVLNGRAIRLRTDGSRILQVRRSQGWDRWNAWNGVGWGFRAGTRTDPTSSTWSSSCRRRSSCKPGRRRRHRRAAGVGRLNGDERFGARNVRRIRSASRR